MTERLFDQDEKEFIKHLNSHAEGTSIQNYLDPNLSQISVFLSQGQNAVFFRFAIQTVSPTQQELEWIKTTSDELQLKIVKLTRSLKYLESKGLVFSFVPAYHQTSTIQFGQCPINSHYVSYQIYDPQTILAMQELVDKIILPTPSLSELQSNNFRFPEEVRFEKSKKLSWIGIWVAIVLSVIGILSNSYLSYVSYKESNHDIQSIKGHLNQIKRNSSELVTKYNEISQLIVTQTALQENFFKEATSSILLNISHQLKVLNNTFSNEAKMTLKEIDRVSTEISNILSNRLIQSTQKAPRLVSNVMKENHAID